MGYEKYTKVTPGSALLTLAEIQDYLHVDDPGDDDLINGLIDGWTKWAEEYCWTNFNSTVWKIELSAWPSGPLRVTKNPVTSVTSITYYDDANDSQTLSSALYKVYTDIPALIEFESTPSLYDRVDAVTVNFTVAQSDAADAAKLAVKSLIGLQYLQREDFKPDGTYITMAKRILAPYRLNFF